MGTPIMGLTGLIDRASAYLGQLEQLKSGQTNYYYTGSNWTIILEEAVVTAQHQDRYFGLANQGYGLAGDIGNAVSGLLEGAQYRQYLGTIRPSPAYGVNVYTKPILIAVQAAPLTRQAGYLGHAVNLATIGVVLAEEEHFCQKTKVATAKALTGWA